MQTESHCCFSTEYVICVYTDKNDVNLLFSHMRGQVQGEPPPLRLVHLQHACRSQSSQVQHNAV